MLTPRPRNSGVTNRHRGFDRHPARVHKSLQVQISVASRVQHWGNLIEILAGASSILTALESDETEPPRISVLRDHLRGSSFRFDSTFRSLGSTLASVTSANAAKCSRSRLVSTYFGRPLTTSLDDDMGESLRSRCGCADGHSTKETKHPTKCRGQQDWRVED